MSRGIHLLFLVFLVSLSGSCKKEKALLDAQINSPGESQSPSDDPGSSPPTPIPVGPGSSFLYGSNMGSYQGWTDGQLAALLIGDPTKNIEGAGVNSLRPAMYDHFVERWGYNIRVGAFEMYRQLGGKDHTIFLNGPSEEHRDQTMYCDGVRSKTFANLYEPIWSAEGEVNPENYYANYVYNVVQSYGSYVKYWEVWNEPDYTNSWSATRTWTETDPDPCHLSTFNAPIQSYVRMLRITHEIVRKFDSDGQVCVGGLGYSSFLDAILRNTDNPDGGKVTDQYPKKGGDWFDCLSYHVYPMYYLGENRNSDAAAAALINHKNGFQAVLTKYSYDGTTKPEKTFIVTETNIPRKAVDNYVGGDEVQRNYLIKSAIVAQKNGISGLYIFCPAESRALSEVTAPYQAMGFYERITSGPYNATITPGGVAWRTVSTLLRTRHYDHVATAALQLPSNVDGGAFYSAEEGNHIYVLWAKTTGASENATAEYRFPASLGIKTATQFNWENKQASMNGSTVSLTGSPVFVKPS